MAPPPLFRPFRALGSITDDVPFAVQRRGKETFVTVSVGRAWQMYNCGKLRLVFVGPQLRGRIRALACKNDLTFAAVRHDVVVCKRLHRVAVMRGHTAPIIQLLVLGDHLLSLDSAGHLLTWSLPASSSATPSAGDAGHRAAAATVSSSSNPAAPPVQLCSPQSSMQLPTGLTPTCMAHPDTYLNKLVIGTEQGPLLLVNFVTRSVLYTFPGWGCAVRGLASSPALDVMGIALADGRAALHNLRCDESVVVFANAAGVGLATGLAASMGSEAMPAASPLSAGAASCGCRALAFSTGPGTPLMAAAGGQGVVTVWDLEERRLHTMIRDAHDAPVLALHFFAGEPLLMSAGADNSIKHWVFDSAEGTARLLRFRSGHAAPPTVVAHYGEGLRLLTAGSDRAFRVFSTIQDQQSRELSQKHAAHRAKKLKVRESEVKLSRVIAMDACTVRERDWANVITAHEDNPTAYVWRLAHFTLGEHELRPPQPLPAAPASRPEGGPRSQEQLLQAAPHLDQLPLQQPSGGALHAPVTSVSLSPCGNFGLVGSGSGRVDKYNMQSGLHRGVFGRPPVRGTGKQGGKGGGSVTPDATVSFRIQAEPVAGDEAVLQAAHDGPVTGLAVDSCNRILTTAGMDGWLRLWDFRTLKLRCEVCVGRPITRLALHPGSGLAAVACDNQQLLVYDIEAGGRLVRRFKGHRDRITGLQLSADSRWLLSSAMDGSLRVWDVAGALCLQSLRLGAPITAFSLSPALDMLATCHINRRGVYLWSNQATFGNPADFTPSELTVDVGLPSMAGGDAQTAEGQQGVDMQREPELPAHAGHAAGGKAGVSIAGMSRGLTPRSHHPHGGAAGSASDSGSDDDDDDGNRQPGSKSTSGGHGKPAGSGRRERGEVLEAGSSEEDEGYEAEDGPAPASAAAASATAAVEAAVREAQARGGGLPGGGAAGAAPQPLAPSLVTLSLLPRTQWTSLVQLEAIKQRNRPIEPPKKPESAPFFLPTIPNVEGVPTFAPPPASTTQAGTAAEAGSTAGLGPGSLAAAAAASKVLRVKQAQGNTPAASAADGRKKGKRALAAEAGASADEVTGDDRQGASEAPGGRASGAKVGAGSVSVSGVEDLGVSRFVRLLRAGQDAGDWASFLALLRTLSPVAVDREVRALQVLAPSSTGPAGTGAGLAGSTAEPDDPVTAAALRDLRALLECIHASLVQGSSFEFCQALLQLVLQVHGETISEREELQAVAQRVLDRLKPVWQRLDGLLQNCQCMVSFFGNLPA